MIRHGRVIVLSSLTVFALAVGRLSAVPAPIPDEGGVATVGADVIVGSLPNMSKYGTVNGVSAYAIGTTSCNIGDKILLWCDSDVPGLCNKTQHPVIAQNLYRLKNGRLEMIGMSWLKHGFCALAENLCSPCTFDPWGCDALGIGCSDPYDSTLNGSQGGLGPRSQVNPYTGIFPYPFTAPGAPATIGRRLQVPVAALDPAQNAGALYFGEGHYISPDDAAAGNATNNASYRRVTVGTFTNGSWTLALTGATFQQKAAIQAWKDNGLGVGVPDPSVVIQNIDVAGDGRFIVAYKVNQNLDGTWHYEYAVQNLNSDRAARSWFIPVPTGVTITNLDQNIVSHHSGEPYATTAWTMTSAAGGTLWNTQTWAQNANANALRWGTMFNFRFDADQPPVNGTATLGLFKAGAAPDATLTVLVPGAPPCPADLSGDGFVDGVDLATVLGQWGAPGSADLDGSGIVDGADLAIVLGAWGDCN